MSREGVAVIEFPMVLSGDELPLRQTQDIVKAAVGRVVALLDLALLSVNAGLAIVGAGGAGTSLPATRAVADLNDAFCDQVRLVVHGLNSTATPRTVQLYDVTNSLVLASIELPSAATTVISAWTTLQEQAGDRTLELRVIGNGADTQTLYAAHAQFRTVKFQR